MTFISNFCFICVLIVGFTNGAQIGKRGQLKPQNGGKTVSISDYPYMASMKVQGSLVGSGVIIDKNWILTIAANVYGARKGDIEFRVGSNDFNSGGQVLEAQKVIRHKKYTGSWDYNIAVVRVNEIKFNKRVSPINLATQDAQEGLTVQVSGWGELGSSGSLGAANLTVMDWKTCKEYYSNKLTPRLMCTYAIKNEPCANDFGDPIVANNQVYGLFAGGHSCHIIHDPQLYADVPAFNDWIKEQINEYSD